MDEIHDLGVVRDVAVRDVGIHGARGRRESQAVPLLNHPFDARLLIPSFCFLPLNCHPIRLLLELEGPAVLG